MHPQRLPTKRIHRLPSEENVLPRDLSAHKFKTRQNLHRIPVKNPAAQPAAAPLRASFFCLSLATKASVNANVAPIAAKR